MHRPYTLTLWLDCHVCGCRAAEGGRCCICWQSCSALLAQKRGRYCRGSCIVCSMHLPLHDCAGGRHVLRAVMGRGTCVRVCVRISL